MATERQARDLLEVILLFGGHGRTSQAPRQPVRPGRGLGQIRAAQGPQIANEIPFEAWMLTNNVLPSGLKVDPANTWGWTAAKVCSSR